MRCHSTELVLELLGLIRTGLNGPRMNPVVGIVHIHNGNSPMFIPLQGYVMLHIGIPSAMASGNSIFKTEDFIKQIICSPIL